VISASRLAVARQFLATMRQPLTRMPAALMISIRGSEE
jgi:stage V sporulation protein SpoVS